MSNTSRRRSAAQRRRIARRNMILVGAGVVVVVVIAVVVALTSGGTADQSSATTTAPAAQDTASVVAGITGVAPTVIDQVGAGTLKSPPKALTGEALTADGKPSLLYVGAEYCPFCAGERWAIVNALSRFGTFSGLELSHSSSTDVYPNTATFTFRDATYASDYLHFESVEVESNEPDGKGGYKALQTPTDEQLKVFTTANPSGSFPFLDIAGDSAVIGASYDVGVLQGKTAEQIGAALATPTDPATQGIVGTANVLTAAICQTTNQQPADVCSAAGVQAAKAKLPSA